MLVSFGALASGGAASAETLPQALSEAAAHNATILAQRARADAAGEAVAIGEAGYYPNVSIAGTARLGTLPGTIGAPVSDGSALGQRTLSYSATAEQPIFDGFKTYHTVAAAEANADAARQDLASVTQAVLMETVAAYTDVIRSGAVSALRARNVANLEKELAATRERSAKGESSAIDMQQAAARLADASDAMASAEADQDNAGARFEMATGHPPGQLVAPTLPSAALPGSLDEALAAGSRKNPRVVSALKREDAAQHDIGAARSALLPKVLLEAQYQRTFVQAGPPLANDQSVSLAARVVVPLIDGGASLASVRQAKYLHAARLQAISEQRAAVASDIATAWAQLAAARKRIGFNAKAVSAHRAALAGLRTARKAGQRTTLDVLDAERDLIEAQIRGQQGKRDLIVAGYALLAATGGLQAP